jgi:Zn-dependent peptidase ImmA (M78 family)/DNA-binding XRE family transcriptional regulator
MDGNRLKLARTAAGLSLRGLADRMGNAVTAQAIGKYERDEMSPGSDTLLALAHALGVSEDYLLSAGRVELSRVDFRKKASTSTRDTAAISAKILSEVERYLALEEALGLDSSAWRTPGEPYPAIRSVEDAEDAARALRDAWEMGIDPVPNLAELLEEQGIKVIATELPSSVSGLLCSVKREGPDVPVHNGERQRFSLGHELGHLFMQSHLDDKENEKACHRFSGAFLIDASLLRREVGNHRRSLPVAELFELKSLFGLSVQAIAFRCRDLGIIGEPTMRELFTKFSQLGWRSPPYQEPNPIRSEHPQRFRRLCLRALAEHAVSESRAAELLGVNVRELDTMLDAPI